MKVLVALLLVSTPALARKKVNIGDEPVPVGLEIRSENTLDVTLSMTVQMDEEERVMQTRQSDHEVRTVKALEVDGTGNVTRHQVSWGKHRHEESGVGPEQAFDRAIVGPTFVVRGTVPSRTDGEPLSHAQGRFFAGYDDPFDDVRRFSADLVGRKVKVGDVIESDQIFPAQGLTAGAPAGASYSGTMTLKEIRPGGDQGVAAFDVDFVVTVDEAGQGDRMQMRMSLGGEVLIDVATGWVSSAVITGPMTMSANNSVGMALSGTGTFTARQSHTFVR